MKLFFKKRFLMGVIVFTSGVSLTAQKKEYSLSDNNTKVSVLVDFNKTKFTVADIASRKIGQPLAEARLYKLGVNMDTIGKWSTLSAKEKCWKLVINVPRNKGFTAGFDDFYLPEGSRLFVYQEGKLDNAIMYLNEDNPKGGPYSLENLSGDNIVLEYIASENITKKPRLILSSIGYKYLDNQNNSLSGFNAASNSCMVNINCPEGNLWKNQKKGILQLRVGGKGGTYLCSGVLLNNTNNDKTPYVLTAQHCFENSTVEEAKNTEFFFEYESPGCESVRPTYKYHKGADVLIVNPLHGGSDGVLMKLTENIPDNWDVYYNGWDIGNTGNDITSGAVIHHPQGDVKKITLYNQPLVSGKWSDNSLYPEGTHWVVNYSLGVTSGGSSGSPIFNQNGLVVGTLTGGDSECSQPSLPDFYGKFWYHWGQSPNQDLHMSKYLDPNKVGTTKLKGLAAIDGANPNPDQQPDLYAHIENDLVYVYAKGVLKKVTVSDLFGRIVYSKTSDFMSPTVLSIPIGNWQSGVYVIYADVEGKSTKSVKIIK